MNISNQGPDGQTSSQPPVSPDNRRVRIFISSTFRDMEDERNALMIHAWPELRRFCRDRRVELVEVDLRWGISEEQCTRKETLKLCLDEIRACRPFFIGLLGERYGWVPGEDAYSEDLKEEQPWLNDLRDRSVTELEILHGVLNAQEMAGRSFFYFRDPAYAHTKGPDFLPESVADEGKQAALKKRIRAVATARIITVREGYSDPGALVSMVLEDLKAALSEQFPVDAIPDPLMRDRQDHEAFAEIRRRTYISRPDYFEALDHHAQEDGGPLVILGESGSGKSALLANWIASWRERHPEDFIVQHYIGGTADSGEHWQLMTRIMAEVRQWTNDPEDLPTSHDDIRRDFPVWLAKGRLKAERDGIRFILVIDALNQLEDQDHARLLGWLPGHPFQGPLRLFVSTLAGETLDAVKKRGWGFLSIEPLSFDERRRMITDYLARFSKKLDTLHLDRLASAGAANNPLYLKILLDELRVTGTYEGLDERLNDYLSAVDIPALLTKVLTRYQKDYEQDRPGLVRDALGLIWSARRGLTETELLGLLRPADLPQLPPAVWIPLRAALDESLIDRAGILNFAHDFFHKAVKTTFVSDQDAEYRFRLQLAAEFEAHPISARSCDELPWLLRQTQSSERLRVCLLDIDKFLEISKRDMEELRGYWVWLGKERTMGKFYLDAFNTWEIEHGQITESVAYAASQLASFLYYAALYDEAEPFVRRALAIREKVLGPEHPHTALSLNNIAALLYAKGDFDGAEPLYRRALAIEEKVLGPEHPDTASTLNNLAALLHAKGDYDGAESLDRRALAIREKVLGPEHPHTALSLNSLAVLLDAKGDYDGAESLYCRALAIYEKALGPEHPDMAVSRDNLANLLKKKGAYNGAEYLCRLALASREKVLGSEHPDTASTLNNLAALLYAKGDFDGAEPLYRQALAIRDKVLGSEHPNTASTLSNLAALLYAKGDFDGAEPLYRRALAIEEKVLGPEHPDTASTLNNLAALLYAKGDFDGAEPLYRKALAIQEKVLGSEHPDTASTLNNLAALLYTKANFDGAEPLYRRALAIYEKVLGPEHHHTAQSINSLAAILKTKGDYDGAESLYRRALAIYEKVLGPEHPDTALSLTILGSLLCSKGDYEKAEPLYRRALAIRERVLGSNHSYTADSLSNLAAILCSKGDYNDAESLCRRALVIYEKVLGPEHHGTTSSINNLAAILYSKGDYNGAEPLYRRALAIEEKVLGAKHPTVVTALNNLAVLLYAKGDYVGAETLYRQALAIREQVFGPNHPDTATSLSKLANILYAKRDYEAAEPLYRRALSILFLISQSMGQPHPELQRYVNAYTACLNKMGYTHEQLKSALHELAPDFFPKEG